VRPVTLDGLGVSLGAQLASSGELSIPSVRQAFSLSSSSSTPSSPRTYCLTFRSCAARERIASLTPCGACWAPRWLFVPSAVPNSAPTRESLFVACDRLKAVGCPPLKNWFAIELTVPHTAFWDVGVLSIVTSCSCALPAALSTLSLICRLCLSLLSPAGLRGEGERSTSGEPSRELRAAK